MRTSTGCHAECDIKKAFCIGIVTGVLGMERRKL